MTAHEPQLRVRVRFVRFEDGGRRAPPTELTSGLYRPHFVVEPLKDRTLQPEEYLGVMFIDGPETAVPDVDVDATVLLVYQDVDYGSLQRGVRFRIMEGAHAVGTGIVLAPASERRPS